MNIGVAIVSTRKSKLASFSRSVLIFGASPARFVALMNIENPCYRRSSYKTKGAGHGPHNSAPLIAVVGNHPVFRWFASLHLFKLLLRMHHTSQGLILGCVQISNISIRLGCPNLTTTLRYHARNSTRGPLPDTKEASLSFMFWNVALRRSDTR